MSSISWEEKNSIEGVWICGKVAAGGSVHDYYPPSDENVAAYERETGQAYHR